MSKMTQKQYSAAYILARFLKALGMDPVRIIQGEEWKFQYVVGRPGFLIGVSVRCR